MRHLRLVAVLFSLATAALAQSTAHQSFDTIKSLAGSWQGDMGGKPLHVSLRVTSMGNTVMHEMSGDGGPEDPISMFHMDGERLMLDHYCDAGNQPHMLATTSPDGKTITFDFVDGSNLLPGQAGHMKHVVFHVIDADHHTESWNFAGADGRQVGGLLDLRRTK